MADTLASPHGSRRASLGGIRRRPEVCSRVPHLVARVMVSVHIQIVDPWSRTQEGTRNVSKWHYHLLVVSALLLAVAAFMAATSYSTWVDRQGWGGTSSITR
jgi:hypothetical protein